jgi:hypothetical protein
MTLSFFAHCFVCRLWEAIGSLGSWDFRLSMQDLGYRPVRTKDNTWRNQQSMTRSKKKQSTNRCVTSATKGEFDRQWRVESSDLSWVVEVNGQCLSHR